MKNVRFSLPLVDGGSMPLEFETTKDVVVHLAGDDVRPPPRCLVIEAQAEDGRVISITFPYDRRQAAAIRITEREGATMPYEVGARLRHDATNELGTVRSCEFNGPVLVQTDLGVAAQWSLDDVRRA
jgi:hypothetical protein